MRKVHLAGLLLAIATCSTAAHAAGGNITGTLGFRQVDEDQWSPTDTQGLIGGIADFSYWDFPVHFEIGLRGSRDTGSFTDNAGISRDARQTIGDFLLGVVLMPDYGPMRPYFGGGLAFTSVEAKVERANGWDSDDDTSVGAYVGGGILWRLGPNFDIGIDGRYIGGTSMNVFGNEVDVDGYTVAMRVGYGWDWYPGHGDSGGRPGPRRRRW